MKRIVILISIMLVVMTMTAQTLLYERPHRDFTDCFEVLVLDDGNIVEVEDYFIIHSDEMGNITTENLGVNLIKLDKEAQFLDSVFVKFPEYNDAISNNCILAHNPNEENSYFLADFYYKKETERFNYKAVFFDNDLNTTDVVDVQFDDFLVNMQKRSPLFIDHNNDLVFCASLYDGFIAFIKIDIYGNIKKISYSDYKFQDYFVRSHAFVYDKELSYYGFIFPNRDVSDDGLWEGEGGLHTVFVIDDNLNVVEAIELYSIGEDKEDGEDINIHLSYGVGNNTIFRLNNDNLALFSGVMHIDLPHPTKYYMRLTYFDKDFNVIGSQKISEEYRSNSYFLVPTEESVTVSDDGYIYLNWFVMDNQTNTSKYYVACVDEELNLLWRKNYYTTKPNAILNSPTIRTTAVLDNGCLVIGGSGDYIMNPEAAFNYPIVFIVGKDGTSTSEYHSSSNNFSIYPNPASDFVKISSTSSQPSIVKVYNCLGMLVEEFEMNSEEIGINISDYNSGVYFVEVDGEIVKVVKN